ncbi:MAG: hypothetical protein B7Y90_01130 [Alphaproteobacteria bacterium 32-64-14]|nr:MAG: hypothetical protein B7Y90_01130 [Alphaproteobacteria bacterium 32-64-14]
MNRFAILAIALAASTGGCNMVSGLGQDLQALGGAMSDTAADVQARSQPQTPGDPATCTTDAHGRTHGAGCAPPPLNTPPQNTPQEPAPIVPPQ